ncbi:MAG TPA: DUF4087 domain-containing protein [Sphingomicrobium sp.]
MNSAISLLMIIAAAAPAQAAERRCGWLANPTPANWWLTDRAGEWIIGVQGGYQAPGMDNLPDMSTKGWVNTNGSYGYGCACMTVQTNQQTKYVTRIISAKPVPLAQCRGDPKLPHP